MRNHQLKERKEKRNKRRKLNNRGENMKKRILSVLLSTSIVLGSMSTLTMAANEDTVIEVIQIVNNHPLKGLIMGQLKANIKTDSGIDFIKNLVNLGLTSKDKEDLEKKGITTKDIHDSLDDMKTWDIKSREDLIRYVENGEIDKAKELVKEQSKPETPEKPVEPEKPEGPKPEVPEVPEIPEIEEPVKPEPELPEIEEPEVEEPEKPEEVEIKFTDIKGHWAEANIKAMAELKLVSGISDTKFAPNDIVTRGQMVALIVRMLDIETDEDANLPFTDVRKDSWDYGVIKAAYDAKLVSGTSETTFKPNKEITREQMMVMMINGLKDKKITRPDIQKDLTKFKDHEKISSWAREAMQEGANIGLISGKDGNVMDPLGRSSRAEAVTVLKQAYDLLNK